MQPVGSDPTVLHASGSFVERHSGRLPFGLLEATVAHVPRPPRVQVPGGIFHLMNRGVRGAPPLTDDRERHFFIDLVAEGCARYRWLLRAYCLMGNHYHLLVTTMDVNLSRGMQWLNGYYAQWLSRAVRTRARPGSGQLRRLRQNG